MNNENEKLEIVYLPVDKLHPHIDNPRKNVGDVTELAESIKAQGIHQSLMVIPGAGHNFGEYTVIIGHRRLAAAKLAGLTEVPCVIREGMSKAEQVSTMLLENMQRSDLTVWEQAQGMQMMLDLGDDIAGVSEKTGLSETTVRRRVRLLQLDEDKFKKSEGKQINMLDYDKLFEIKDAKLRNEALEKIGTSDFNYTVTEKKRQEESKKEYEKALECISSFAEKAEILTEKKSVDFVRTYKDAQKIKKTLLNVKYYYIVYGSGTIAVYRDYTEEEKKNRQEKGVEFNKKNQHRIEKEKAIGEVCGNALKCRLEFVKSLTHRRLNMCANNAYYYISEAIFKINNWNVHPDGELYKHITGIDVPKSLELSKWREMNSKKVVTLLELFILAYCILEDAENITCVDYNLNYKENPSLKRLYDMLEILGYEISADEKAMLDGTHKVYKS